MSDAAQSSVGRPKAFSANWGARLGWFLLVAYLIYAGSQLGFSAERFSAGIEHGQHFLSRMFPPNFGHWDLIVSGIAESLQIAVIATFAGIVISLPVGLMAARNLTPAWISWPMRAFIALCRSFHPIIVAILFVKAIGFGALAGVMALIVASIGFISKLFAEAIEEISAKQVEAVRATGAGFLSVLIMGVQPQVLPRFIGFATYQLDSNLRNSTMVGIVGGGGIGASLFTAYQRFDFDVVLAILIVIVSLIMIAEILSRMGTEGVPVNVAARLDRDWQRFTPLKRLSRFGFYLCAVVALVVSLRTIDVIPEFLYDAPEQVADLFKRMWPLDLTYLRPTLKSLIETLHIATVGTVIAIVLAVPVGLLAARNVTPNFPLNLFAKFIFVTSRSINSLVWALLFVAVFGPGPLAGTFAIAFRSIGFTGKLFAEAMEEANKGSIEALTAAGASKFSILLFGYWPQVRPAFWSIALFRWDINIRESAVLGLVGAGGIGVALDTALNLLYWDQVAVVLLAIFIVVILAEIIVTAVRTRIL